MTESREHRFYAFARSGEAPASYKHNSPLETGALSATASFEKLYHKFFPNRKPLLLTAVNECGQRKPICTFVRPTAVQYDDLFNLENCCKFIAGYVGHEPLHTPALYAVLDDTIEHFPSQVASPATALEWQVGNCLEASLVLVSFLRGIGYNAYVVTGYACTPVCLGDLSDRMWENDMLVEVNSDDEDEPAAAIDADYLTLMKERPRLRHVSDPDPWKCESSDDGTDSDRAAQKTDDATGEAARHGSASGGGSSLMGYQVRPAHCWVLVLPGGRKDVKQATFVEPSTGELIPLAPADAFYTGIESVFNEKNYHVNLRDSAPVSAVAFDLRDASRWESVFTAPVDADDRDGQAAATSFGASRSRGGAAGDSFGGTMSGRLGDTTSSGAAASVVAHLALAAAAKSAVAVPRSWASALVLTPIQHASRHPGRAKVLRYADATVRLYAEYSQADLRVREVRLPDTEFPELEQVHIFYAHRADHLRRRSIFPQSESAASQHQDSGLLDDHSISRSQSIAQQQQPGGGGADPTQPQTYRLLHEWYDIGRMRGALVEGLREFLHAPGQHRTLRYYWRSREDGLAQRQERFYDAGSLRKVREVYRGRVDRLCSRNAAFERPRTVREGNAHGAIVNPSAANGLKDLPRLAPVRMSQKYERDPAVAPERDVAKTKFLRPQSGDEAGELWVFFHYGDGSITRPCRMYAKRSSKVEDYIAASSDQRALEPPVRVVSLPGQAPPTELELFNERKWLTGMEADCVAEVRARMEEQLATVLAMERDHAQVQPALSSYDTLRNRPKETEAERALALAEATRREESRKDYLAPYIAKLEMAGGHSADTANAGSGGGSDGGFNGNYLQVRLTAEQGKQVRDEALTELKERLIQRGHIMQTRMDAEKEDFSRRQAHYQKNADAAAVDGGKEAEEFARYCKEATWRMKVLDERLAKHIDHASERYAALAQRLADDRRLAALYNS